MASRFHPPRRPPPAPAPPWRLKKRDELGPWRGLLVCWLVFWAGFCFGYACVALR